MDSFPELFNFKVDDLFQSLKEKVSQLNKKKELSEEDKIKVIRIKDLIFKTLDYREKSLFKKWFVERVALVNCFYPLLIKVNDNKYENLTSLSEKLKALTNKITQEEKKPLFGLQVPERLRSIILKNIDEELKKSFLDVFTIKASKETGLDVTVSYGSDDECFS